MPSINDWAAKAAERIYNETVDRAKLRGTDNTKERIAAIIAEHAASLVALLREARREHLWNEDDKCDKLNKIDPAEKVCICGADAWNARIDAVLASVPKAVDMRILGVAKTAGFKIDAAWDPTDAPGPDVGDRMRLTVPIDGGKALEFELVVAARRVENRQNP